MEEVLVAFSSVDTNAYVVDPGAGTQIAVFKNTICPPSGVALISTQSSEGGVNGPGDYIICAQSKGQGVLAYRWGREAACHRGHAPERLRCLAAAGHGAFVLGGGAAGGGTVHVWAAGGGDLLRSFEAHYRTVNCIAAGLGTGGDLVVTGGADALVRCWGLVDLVAADEGGQKAAPPRPRWTASAHRLPVQAVGPLPGPSRVASVSLDRTAKVWELGSGACVLSVTCGAGLRALAADPAGRFLYLGQVPGLIQEVPITPTSADSGGGGGGGGLASGATGVLMVGHTAAVVSLALSAERGFLVSGSEDGTCRLWDPPSKQCLRTLKLHKGPVSQVLLCPRPAAALSLAGAAGGGAEEALLLGAGAGGGGGGGKRKRGGGGGGGGAAAGQRRAGPLPPAWRIAPLQPLRKFRAPERQVDASSLDSFLDSIPCTFGLPQSNLCLSKDDYLFTAQSGAMLLQKGQGSKTSALDSKDANNPTTKEQGGKSSDKKNVFNPEEQYQELMDKINALQNENQRWQKVNSELMKKLTVSSS